MGRVASTLRTGSEAVTPEKAGVSIRLARALWVLCATLVVSGLALDFLTPHYLSPNARPGVVLALVFGLLSLACTTVGAAIASSQPGNRVGWIFCAMGLLCALRRFAATYADYALVVYPSLPLGNYAAWLSTWVGTWDLIACGILLALVLPAGRLPSRRWRPAVWVLMGGVVLLAAGEAFRAGPVQYYVGNPLGIPGPVGGVPAYRILEFSSGVGGTMLLVVGLLSFGALLRRRGRVGGDEHGHDGLPAGAILLALAGSLVMLLDLTVERFASLLAGRVIWPGLWLTNALAGVVGLDVEPGRAAELRFDAILSTGVTVALLCVSLFVLPAVLGPRALTVPRVLGGAAGARTALGLRLRWTRVLASSVLAGMLPFAFVYLGVYAVVLAYFATGNGAPDEQWLGRVGAFASGWGARFFFLVATLLLAWWTARGAWERVALHGVLVGLLGALINQTVVRLFVPPVTLTELSAYVAFGAVGGALGGVLGRASLTGEVYRASRQIGEAKDPDTVAAALGEHLGGPDVCGVYLWRYLIGEDAGTGAEPARDLALWGSWRRGEGSRHAAESLRGGVLSVLGRLGRDSPVAIRLADLPAAHRGPWEREGVRTALLIPLSAPGEAWRGVALVGFGNGQRFSRNWLRAYLTISAQASLVLENLRLVDEARDAGRQAGVLVERQRMAHEIHDTLAQGFASVIVSLSAAEMSRGAQPGSQGEWSRHLREARRTARESLKEARRLVWALRPESLDRRSLPEALEVLAREWSEDTGIEARVTTSGAACSLRPEAEVALLRAAQESLTNVRKHARARSVTITLSYIGDRVVLDVLDDGLGFDALRPKTVLGAHDTGGFGLKAMRERVEQLGGTLLVESGPGEGSTIVVELPLAADDPRDLGSAEEVRDA